MKSLFTKLCFIQLLLLTLSMSSALANPIEDRRVGRELGLTEENLRNLRLRKGLTYDEIRAIPKQKLDRLIDRLKYTDLPELRVRFLNRNESLVTQIRGESVNPREILLRQYETFFGATGGATRARPGNVAGLPVGPRRTRQSRTAGISPGPLHWQWLGPSNVGGRCRSMLIDPDNPSRFWLASVAGGIWITEDGGKNFAPVNDFMENLAICTMAFDPKRKGRIYFGTGERFYNKDGIRGAGIFYLNDSGQATKIEPTLNPNPVTDSVNPARRSDFEFVNRLAFSSDGTTLYAATANGLLISSDQERRNWEKPLAAKKVTDLITHPSIPGRAVISTMSGAVYFTSNSGKTWTKSTTQDGQWSGRASLCYAAANHDFVYALVDFGGNAPAQIWRSEDGGQIFSRRKTDTTNETNILGGQGAYSNTIWAGDPHDPEFVIAGGFDLWRSTNGGTSLTPISQYNPGSSVHPDHHAIVAEPGYGTGGRSRIYFLNDGGIYATDEIRSVGSNGDLNKGWVNLNENLGITQFYQAAADPSGRLMVAGTQDNGTQMQRLSPGGTKWTNVLSGDGGFCAVDSSNPNIYYGEYIFLTVYRSIDSGEYLGRPIYEGIPDADHFDRSNFIAPFILDPNDNKRMLAGGLQLWETKNCKDVTVRPGFRSIKETSPEFAKNRNFISAIAIDKSNSNVVVVGHNRGDLYVTSNSLDAVPNWLKIDDNSFPNATISDVCIDGRNLYVVFDNYESINVWHSPDLGESWRPLNSDLKIPVRAVTVHPKNSRFIYLGTELGVFASENGGDRWISTNEGPSNCPVYDLFWIKNDLVAATHGRGIFRINLDL